MRWRGRSACRACQGRVVCADGGRQSSQGGVRLACPCAAPRPAAAAAAVGKRLAAGNQPVAVGEWVCE